MNAECNALVSPLAISKISDYTLMKEEIEPAATVYPEYRNTNRPSLAIHTHVHTHAPLAGQQPHHLHGSITRWRRTYRGWDLNVSSGKPFNNRMRTTATEFFTKHLRHHTARVDRQPHQSCHRAAADTTAHALLVPLVTAGLVDEVADAGERARQVDVLGVELQQLALEQRHVPHGGQRGNLRLHLVVHANGGLPGTHDLPDTAHHSQSRIWNGQLNVPHAV